MVDSDTQLHIKKEQDKQRAISDQRYAIKLVEKIVFGALGIVSLAVLYKLLTVIQL